MQRRPATVVVSLAIALGAIIYFCCRGRGYFSDEGSFCTIGQGILRGEYPYRSYFNEKPPLQYFWTAAIMAISWPTLSGARLAATAMLVLTAVCILRGPAERPRNLSSVLGWTGLIFLVAVDLLAFNDTAESSLAFLFCASALLIVHPGSDRRRVQGRAILQGAIFGVAVGFRQTAIAPAAIMLLLPHASLPKRSYCCGFVLGVLCWLGPLIALGIGPEFFQSTLTFHVDNPSATTYFRGLNENEHLRVGLWLVCLGCLAIAGRHRERGWWPIVWSIAMAVPFFGRMDVFRLWPSMAAMLVLIAHTNREKWIPARASAIAIASIAMIALVSDHPRRFPHIVDLSNAIAAATQSEDRIWVGPFDPIQYCLAQRAPASRYYFILPWTAKADVRREIVDDIVKSSPRLIVIGDYDDDGPFGLQQLLPELRGVIAERYHLSALHGGASFFERNAVPADSPTPANAALR